jgi:hypothetical protein
MPEIDLSARAFRSNSIFAALTRSKTANATAVHDMRTIDLSLGPLIPFIPFVKSANYRN